MRLRGTAFGWQWVVYAVPAWCAATWPEPHRYFAWPTMLGRSAFAAWRARGARDKRGIIVRALWFGLKVWQTK